MDALRHESGFEGTLEPYMVISETVHLSSCMGFHQIKITTITTINYSLNITRDDIATLNKPNFNRGITF